MEFFQNAQFVRLRSHLGSYLYADDGGEIVSHGYRRNSHSTMWAVECAADYIRLLGQHGLYLGATDIPFLLDGGTTSCRVHQGVPATPNDNAFLWSPRREGLHITLSGPFGHRLRANFGPASQHNTVTVDFGVGTDWSFWAVEVVGPAEVASSPSSLLPPLGKPCSSFIRSSSLRPQALPRVSAGASLPTLFPVGKVASAQSILAPPLTMPSTSSIRRSSTQFVDPSSGEWLCRPELRTIFYNIASDDSSVDDFNDGTWKYFTFNQRSLAALQCRLEEESGHSDFIICRQNNTEEKLFPLVLDLPPGNDDLEFVLVSEFSRVAKALKWPEGHGPK